MFPQIYTRVFALVRSSKEQQAIERIYRIQVNRMRARPNNSVGTVYLYRFFTDIYESNVFVMDQTENGELNTNVWLHNVLSRTPAKQPLREISTPSQIGLSNLFASGTKTATKEPLPEKIQNQLRLTEPLAVNVRRFVNSIAQLLTRARCSLHCFLIRPLHYPRHKTRTSLSLVQGSINQQLPQGVRE